MKKWTDGRRCPICRSDEYETHTLIGMAGIGSVTHHTCSRCSVMFRDPDRFGDMGRYLLTAEDLSPGAIARQGHDG